MLNRKLDKEGTVSDFITCFFTNVLFGLILRVKGETQEKNTEELIGTLPPIAIQHNKIMLAFDHGYGKMTFVESMSENKIDISTIATIVGSLHPFITVAESNKCINMCKARKEDEYTISKKIIIIGNESSMSQTCLDIQFVLQNNSKKEQRL